MFGSLTQSLVELKLDYEADKVPDGRSVEVLLWLCVNSTNQMYKVKHKNKLILDTSIVYNRDFFFFTLSHVSARYVLQHTYLNSLL